MMLPDAHGECRPGRLSPLGLRTPSPNKTAMAAAVISPALPRSRPRSVEPLARLDSERVLKGIVPSGIDDVMTAPETLPEMHAEPPATNPFAETRRHKLRATRSLSGSEATIGANEMQLCSRIPSRASLATIHLDNVTPVCVCDPQDASCRCAAHERRRTRSEPSRSSAPPFSPSFKAFLTPEAERMPQDISRSDLTLFPARQFGSSRELGEISEANGDADLGVSLDSAGLNRELHCASMSSLPERPSLLARRKHSADESPLFVHGSAGNVSSASPSPRDGHASPSRSSPGLLPSIATVASSSGGHSMAAHSREALREVEQRIRRMSLGTMMREMSGLNQPAIARARAALNGSDAVSPLQPESVTEEKSKEGESTR